LSIKETKYSEKDLLNLLSLRNISNEDLIEIHDDAMEGLDKDHEVMPGNYKGQRKNKLNRKKRKTTKRLGNNPTENVELNKIIKLVDILSPARAANHETRIRVGWCLHNIDDRLLEPWIAFSNKSGKYKQGVYEEKCRYEWDQMDENGLSVGSLYMWAKEDNYGKFKEITANDIRKYILKSLSSAHYDIANVMYQLYKGDFIYTKSKSWYQYADHRWHRISDGIELKRKISNQLLNEYVKFSTEINNKIQQLGDDDDAQKEIYLEQNKKISSIGLKLRANSFKKNIMDECIELFYNSDFEDKLDTNVNLIGFNNGVYDLEHGMFRDGNPDDYISFTTDIDYIEYAVNDEIMAETNLFVQQVLPNKDVREYMLTLLASFLDGKISQEKFHIWTGSGGNGKSKIIELFQNAYGDYTTVLPCSLITQKRARSETCNPVLVKTKGRRFATFQEPEAGEKINVGLMKELTGGDKITARPLYKDPIEFKPQMKQVLTCNDMPQMNGNDDGTWRRVRVVQFTSKFTENPDPENPNEFPIDVYLSEKLDTWAEPFMYLLLQYYKLYKLKGIYEPAIVKLHTSMYKYDSDCFAQFFTEKIGSNKDEGMIHIDEAFYQFTEWYKIANGNSKAPTRKELKTNMMKKYGKSDKEGNIYNGLYWLDITTMATASNLDDDI
jgi:P4 family phage/plasmid primase-like protien